MNRLDVSVVSVFEEHGVLTVAFADHADSPRHWLLLQRTLKPSEQDRDLGQDQAHVSSNVNNVGVYGGVCGATVSPHEVRLLLADDARGHLMCDEDEELIVSIERASVDHRGLADALKRVLHPFGVSTSEP